MSSGDIASVVIILGIIFGAAFLMRDCAHETSVASEAAEKREHEVRLVCAKSCATGGFEYDDIRGCRCLAVFR